MKLSEISSPAALHGCTQEELQALAGDIRTEILRTVARNGGHLASNLGVVELTLALHRALDCPQDKIIFDVGHQCYAHKLLTGRYSRFSTLRQTDGLCGFPRREESPYDAFDTGHASTAISVALGMARARDLQGQHYRVAAVVGDGALTGGMCYEALNDAGSRQTPMMIIINDNGMSISRNVGALSRQLTRLRVSRGWLGMKKTVAEGLLRLPLVGSGLHNGFQKIKNKVRNALVRDKFFTALGFRYFGPLDGHDIAGLERVFLQLRDLPEPVVVHVVTKKGYGFHDAEEKPEKYHGVLPFQLENQQVRGRGGKSLGTVAGEYALELAEKDPRLCVVTAAMTDSAGFGAFAKKHPDRLFDVGIAEEHAVTLAAGMAAAGIRPLVAIYETFLQRSYDQIVEDICLQKLPVCLLMDRAGLGGDDGATHHGIFGVAMLRSIPHITVLSPRCPEELRAMLDWALAQDGPVAIRYPKAVDASTPFSAFRAGKWETLRQGRDAALIGVSAILKECLEAAQLLEQAGIQAAVINASTLKPLDTGCLRSLQERGIPFWTVEEHALTGALGAGVAQACAEMGMRGPAGMIALPDQFIPHGSRKTLLQRYGLTAESIAQQVKKAVQK